MQKDTKRFSSSNGQVRSQPNSKGYNKAGKTGNNNSAGRHGWFRETFCNGVVVVAFVCLTAGHLGANCVTRTLAGILAAVFLEAAAYASKEKYKTLIYMFAIAAHT